MIELIPEHHQLLQQAIIEAGIDVVSDRTGIHPRVFDQIINPSRLPIQLSPALATATVKCLVSLGIQPPQIRDAQEIYAERMAQALDFYGTFIG